jgi:hypothetical protein
MVSRRRPPSFRMIAMRFHSGADIVWMVARNKEVPRLLQANQLPNTDFKPGCMIYAIRMANP